MIRTWYLYLLECQNGRLYSGITTDLGARFGKHLRGKGAMFTRLNRPRRMLAALVCADRAEASKAEYRLKQLSAAGKRQRAAAWPQLPGLPSIEAPLIAGVPTSRPRRAAGSTLVAGPGANARRKRSREAV